MIRRQSLLMPPPHGAVGCFDMTCEKIGVEKREGQAIRRIFFFDGSKCAGMRGEAEGQRFIFIVAVGDELRRAYRMQKTGGNSTGKSIPRHVSTGSPAHIASLAVVWALQ